MFDEFVQSLLKKWADAGGLSLKGVIIREACGDKDAAKCIKYRLKDDEASRTIFVAMMRAVDARLDAIDGNKELDCADAVFYYEKDPNDPSAFFLVGVISELYEYKILTHIKV